MSPAKPTSAPASPLHPAAPSPSKTHYFVTASLRPCAWPQKCDPLFSRACALFSIHNSTHPSCFVKAAHSLPKTPGGGVGLSGQIPNTPLTPIESYSFARITPKPNGILLFQHDPRAWGPLTSSIENPLEQSSAPSSKIKRGVLNLQNAPSTLHLPSAAERFSLENKPAAQLERTRIVRRAGVGVELRTPERIHVAREIRVIENVKRFPAQLEILAFGEMEGFAERGIQGGESRQPQLRPLVPSCSRSTLPERP